MAGHYFYDPRPFYGHNGSNGLMPLDELFYGRYEPVPYWMDQRMAPVSALDDYYYPGHKHTMAMGRPLPQLQQYAYKRPESRDDIGVDMYRRSPYNFHGVAAPAPPLGYGGQHPPRQSQDDTWVHAMAPPPQGQYRHPVAPLGYMPHATMPTNKATNMGTSMGTNMGNHGSQGSKQMTGPSNQFGNGSNQFGNGSNQFGTKSNQFGTKSTGYENHVKSSSQGGKSTNSKQRYAAQGEDSSSDDDSDDEYGNGNHSNGGKWAIQSAGSTHGNGGHNFNQSSKTASKGNSNYGYDNMSSKSKSGGHGGGKAGGNHGSTQSKVSKMLRFQEDDSSSSDSEGYGHSKKSNSKGSSTKMSNHGSLQSHGHQQQQSSKQMQYSSSQSKGVELKVPICCDNCERKVKDCLEYMDGVENVLCDQWNRKVTVYGNVKAENVLKRVRRVKKASELWQQAKLQQQLRAY